MFVGHGLLAFALVAGFAHARGGSRDRSVAIGLLAAGFATIPDLDALHPLVVLALDPVALASAPDTFWSLSTQVHRTATHSLLVGGILAAGLTTLAAARPHRTGRPGATAVLATAGLGLLVGLLTLVWSLDGAVTAGVLGATVVAGLGLTWLATRRELGTAWIGLAAGLGLLTHPFGDLLTGQPPPLLYPMPVDLGLSRVSLHPDPTIHLVGAFLVELATVWLALVVMARIHDVALRDHLDRRALAGFGYAAAAFVLPAPSLNAATDFVFSVTAVGLVGVPVGRPRQRRHWWGITTALAAVTLAAIAYGVAYLAL